MNAVIMTVKGRKDLTWQCLETLKETLIGNENFTPYIYLILVDAGDMLEEFGATTFLNFVAPHSFITAGYLSAKGCGISEGWNRGINALMKTYPSTPREEIDVWLLNNDVIFKKEGWLEALSNRLHVPGTGLVGSSAMSVFGHPFATGGIWGFNLATALSIAEDGKILDEKFNYSCQDVDLSIRMSKAGYVVTHVPGVELGDDPMMTHLVSQTVYSNESEQSVLEKRKPEFEYLIQKHGRKE